jgi:hypothetical protein
MEKMNETYAASSGNRFNKDVVSCIVFDPATPGNAQRIQESVLEPMEVTKQPIAVATNAPNSTSKSKILCCGLGGGLDIVNASLMYQILKE